MADMKRKTRLWHAPVCFAIVVAFAACRTNHHSEYRPSCADRPAGEPCLIRMLIAYAHLQQYAKQRGEFPERVGEHECESNEWLCTSGRRPYRYIRMPNVDYPVLLDESEHFGSHIAMFGPRRVALVPTNGYWSFKTNLSAGKLYIHERWVSHATQRYGL